MSFRSASSSPDRLRATAPVAAALAAALVAAAAVPLLRWRAAETPVARIAVFKLGARALEFDPALLRDASQQAGGAAERVDLALSWRDFGPAPRLARDGAGRATEPPPDAHLLVSLSAADGADPASRARLVYGRFVEPELWSNPGGLLVRRFKAGSPYEGEELFMTPEGREFAARCPMPRLQSKVPPRCIALFRLADIDALASFDASLLPEWRRLKDGVASVLGRALR